MDPVTCEKCGQVHKPTIGDRPCNKHKQSYRAADGTQVYYPKGEQPPCRRPAMHGQTVCSSHGGKAPQNLAAAKARITEQKAQAIMQTYGRPIETTATEALLDELKWTAGYVAWLRERVGELDEAALIWGKTKAVEGDVVVGDGANASLEKATTTTEEAKPHIYRQMLLEEREHGVRVYTAAIKAGIEERKVRLAEKQGELVADVITRILDELNLSPEQAGKVSSIVPRHLRLLTG